mgnify:CR=1 FL=1
MGKYFDCVGLANQPFLYNLLRVWHTVLRDFEITIKDIPYDYRERTNIGFIAAAATKQR